MRISGKNEKSFIRYQWSLLGVDGMRRGSSSCQALGCRPLQLLALPLCSTYSYRDCSLSVSRCSKPIHLSSKSASFVEGLTGASRSSTLFFILRYIGLCTSKKNLRDWFFSGKILERAIRIQSEVKISGLVKWSNEEIIPTTQKWVTCIF